MSIARIAGRIVAALAVWLLFGAQVDFAYATNVVCGQEIFSSVKLEQDLTCTVSALVIRADNVTIDLGGHTITGTVLVPPGSDPRWSGVKTYRGTSFRNVRVMNGTIVGFDHGVDLRRVTGAVIQNVIIRDPAAAGIMALLSSKIGIQEVTISGVNLGIHLGDGTGYAINNVIINGAAPGISVVSSRDVSVNNVTVRDAILGIYALASADIAIRNARVVGIGSESAYAGVALDQVEHADVRNVDVKDAGSGVLLTYSSNSSVKDSYFENVYMGVQLGGISDVMVAGNYITRAGWSNGWGGGIGASGTAGTTTNLRIVDNTVTNSNRGLSLGFITGSKIADNILIDSVYGGIELTNESTGNKITSNTVLGNGIDLLRDDPSFPNRWVDNVCQTYSHPDMECQLHCANGLACRPVGPGGTPVECRAGAMVCAAGQPVCQDAGPLPDGTSCSVGVCEQGACIATKTLIRTASGKLMAVDGTVWAMCVPNEPTPGASRLATYRFGTGTFTLSDTMHPTSSDCTGPADPSLSMFATASITAEGNRQATWAGAVPAGLPNSVIATAAYIHDFDLPALPPYFKYLFFVDDLSATPVIYTGEGKEGPWGPDGYPVELGNWGRTLQP